MESSGFYFHLVQPAAGFLQAGHLLCLLCLLDDPDLFVVLVFF